MQMQTKVLSHHPAQLSTFCLCSGKHMTQTLCEKVYRLNLFDMLLLPNNNTALLAIKIIMCDMFHHYAWFWHYTTHPNFFYFFSVKSAAAKFSIKVSYESGTVFSHSYFVSFVNHCVLLAFIVIPFFLCHR